MGFKSTISTSLNLLKINELECQPQSILLLVVYLAVSNFVIVNTVSQQHSLQSFYLLSECNVTVQGDGNEFKIIARR